MEDLVEQLGKALLAFFRVLIVAIWASVQFAFEYVIWFIGWSFLRIITIGKYPKEGALEIEKAPITTQGAAFAVGIIIPVWGAYLLVRYLGL